MENDKSRFFKVVLYLLFTVVNCGNPLPFELYEGNGITEEMLAGNWVKTSDYFHSGTIEYICFTRSNWFYWKTNHPGRSVPVSEGYGRYKICGLWSETLYIKYIAAFDSYAAGGPVYKDSLDEFDLQDSIQYRISDNALIEYSRTEVIVGNRHKGYSVDELKRYIRADSLFTRDLMWEKVEKPQGWEE